MVNIKVPINIKGTIKLDSAKIADRLQIDQTANSTAQFYKNLLDEDRIVLEEGTLGASGTFGRFTPQTGTTFYLIGVTLTDFISAGTDVDSFLLDSDGDRVERHSISGIGSHNLTFMTQYVKLTGDGIKEITITWLKGVGNTSTASCTIYGYLKNSISP